MSKTLHILIPYNLQLPPLLFQYNFSPHHDFTFFFLEEQLLGGNPEAEEELQLLKTSDREGRNISSEAALSDTSDPDQVNDIEELLQPGYPVYFNYPMPNVTHTLQVNHAATVCQSWLANQGV